ncbi:MAG: S8 family serine peptidase [Flavobacteriales bacterium]|nr:S8 family serine peptidase [Flavobacteriales bacterium]
MKDYEGVKVHKGLTPRNRCSLTRQGDTIPIPDFWTSVVVLLDNSFDLDSTIQLLNECNDVISTAQKNLIYETSDCSTREYLENEVGEDYGEFLEVQDEFFDEQYSVNYITWQDDVIDQDTDGDGYADGNIRAVDAWCYSTGRNDITVGVVDDLIDFMHEDLRDEENGYFVSGWDFFQNSVLNEQSLIGNEWHGTRVAGVIGALSNNGKGVVGIAGGDYRALEQDWLQNDDPNAPLNTDVQLGVQLNAYRVTEGLTTTTEHAAAALVLAVTNDFEENWGDACHILNNSWGLTAAGLEFPWRLADDFDFEVAKGYWFANRNGVVNFTARGNFIPNGGQDRVVYPACYYDHWLVSVGASGDKGTSSSISLDGRGIDVLGPEHNDDGEPSWNVFTTTFDFGQSQIYSEFEGTSSGSPHAAGVGALMLSYYNETFESPDNLYPSDVENLLQMSARNYDVQGTYSDTEGWGIVKAYQALELLESPNYELSHYEAVFTQSDLQLVAQDEIVEIPIVSGEDLGLAEGVYTIDKWMIEEQVNFDIPNNVLPTSSWSLSENTNCFLDIHPDGSDQYLFLDEFSEVSNQSDLVNGMVTLKGYVYHIKTDQNGDQVDLWFPESQEYLIPFSVHFVDNTPISIEENTETQLTVFPNPFTDVIFIQGLSDAQPAPYEICSIDGKVVQTGSSSGSVDLGLLSNGMYILHVHLDDGWSASKILKE